MGKEITQSNSDFIFCHPTSTRSDIIDSGHGNGNDIQFITANENTVKMIRGINLFAVIGGLNPTAELINGNSGIAKFNSLNCVQTLMSQMSTKLIT